MDGVRNGCDEVAQELRCDHLACLLMQFGIGKLGGAVDRHEKIQLAFCGLNLGDIDMQVADRVGFELLLRRLVAIYIRQAPSAVPLQATMQRRTRKVWNGWLERVKTIVERQKRVLPEGDDDGLFLNRKHRRLRLFRAGRKIGDRCPLLPFRNRLLVDAVAFRKRSQALFTILYCSTDCLCRRGAAV
jgi:hypothetical protein